MARNRRQPGANCVSDERLEQVIVSPHDSSPDSEWSLAESAHVAGCAICQRRINAANAAALQEIRQRFGKVRVDVRPVRIAA